MLKSYPVATLCLLALIVFPVQLSAAPAADPQARVASERFAGTLLILVPQSPYERAVVRIAGPEGYSLSQTLPAGSALEVDLLADSEPLSRDRTPSQVEAGADQPMLPDGKYNYELVLFDQAGQRQVQSGSFTVAGGNATSRPIRAPQVLRDQPGPAATGEEPREVTAKSHGVTGDFDDFVSIRNQTGTGQSRLNLNATDSLIVDADTWRLSNDADDNTFNIMEGASTKRLTMLQGGNVGIGTTAPLSPLHIDRTGGFQIRLVGSGADYRIDAFGTSLRIGHASNSNQFRIFADAPFNALTVGANGVGIGTADPSAMLHVAGDAVVSGNVELGSSRTIKREIEPLPGLEALEAVRGLPIYSWKYIDDPHQARHVGPMAEDFHDHLGLGRDAQHLSPTDTSGLALAAVKGVDERLDAQLAGVRREAEALATANQELATENRELRERIEEVERRLEELAEAVREGS